MTSTTKCFLSLLYFSPKRLLPQIHLTQVFTISLSLVSNMVSVHERCPVRGRVGCSARRSEPQGGGPEVLPGARCLEWAGHLDSKRQCQPAALA